jgi:hypothetical protein
MMFVGKRMMRERRRGARKDSFCGHSFDGFVTWWWFGKIKGEGKGALDEDGG